MCKGSTIEAFFALVKAGLWSDGNQEIRIDGTTDWDELYRLATEQSVLGLVLAGLEHSDIKPPKVLLLQWIGEIQLIEQKNRAMNAFINQLIGDLRKANIYTLIVKGQGVAQCYERPLWRSSGDIDFYMNEDDFQKAKIFFRPLVDKFDPDDDYTRHINMHYGEWVVEIHANQHCALSSRINRMLDDVHRDLFYRGSVRSWNNNGTQIFLPSANNDAIIIFTHFFNHFYRGGVGLRQICDWCRLLYTYRDSLNYGLLEQRIKKAGLLDVWKGFAAFAVDDLGMPKEAMPFYSADKKWKKKADRICSFILEVGNFGHNRDSSYYNNDSKLLRKAASFGRRCGDMLHHAKIFPFETFRFFPNMLYYGLRAVVRGE